MGPQPATPDGPLMPVNTLRDVAIVIILAAVLGLPSFFTRDPWNPDEPRYVEVAREMVVLDDYVVPHLNGELYPDKPPLFFWLASFVYRAGVGITSGRVVAVLANLVTLLLVYFFGRRLLPAPGALLAALMTATTFLFLWILKAGVIDPLLALLTTTALIAAYYALRGGGRRLALWVVFYAAGGLAVLTKGPIGLLVPAVVVLSYALLNRKTVSAGGWAHAAGVGAFAVIVGTWLLAVRLHAGAAYAHEIIFGQAAAYTVAKHVSHGHGPHYYLMQIPAYLFPWVFFVALGLAQAYRAWRREGDRDAAFLFLWFVCIFVLFTAIPAKRDRYLLPLVPCAALLCARYLALGLRDGFRRPKLHRRLLW
jgi:4-amino-4-deoxy-L-arabinose transferase-like glycosyltransferase